MQKFLRRARSLRPSGLARWGIAGSLFLVSGGLVSCGSGSGGGTGGASGGAAGEAAAPTTGGAIGQAAGGVIGQATGGEADSGLGGEGGQTLEGPSRLAGKIRMKNATKMDLLFVVDNSGSMADKQAVMRQAIPAMIERLITPNCVGRNAEGVVTYREPGMHAGGEVSCSRSDLSLEFQPPSDIHIGVITSSLGSHGYVGQLSCDEPGRANPEKNDRGRFIPLVRPDDPDVADQPPFLTWNASGDAAMLAGQLGDQVDAAGEIGCGLEAPHEAWYRFLVDPEPPASMSLQNNMAVRGPVDEELLALRRQFLRSDSLVAIVVLTDENDCSAMDGGTYYEFAQYGYLTAVVGSTKNAEPTDICATNPNDKCCQTCIDRPNEGCESHFAKCPEPSNPPRLPPELDQNNVRCFQNQRRFGFDLLYPVERYIDGLSQPEVRGADGDLLPNSLVADRAPGLIFFAGITGVPWQDLATPETLNKPDELKYLTARQLAGPVDIDGQKQSYTYWDLILGKPGKHVESTHCKERSNSDGTFRDPECGAVPVLPRDPFMVESIEPRTGRADLPSQRNDRAKVSITAGPTWNSINGYDYDTSVGTTPNNDLQYACIFSLRPFDGELTAEECNADGSVCDCSTLSGPLDRPLCRRAAGAVGDGGQYFGRAYPSTRTLEILKGFGDNAITASICPKVTDQERPDFGYTPAVLAIADRVSEKLGVQCLSKGLTRSESTGQVPCTVVEARSKTPWNAGAPDLDCGSSSRLAVEPETQAAVLEDLEKAGLCYFEETPEGERRGDAECESYQMCLIQQLEADSAEGEYCLNSLGADAGSPGDAGYCYIDDQQGNPDLLDECGASARQRLRFIYPMTGAPRSGAALFFLCGSDAE